MNEIFKEIFCEYSLIVFLTMLYLGAIKEKERLHSTTSTTNYHIYGIYPETHKQILFLFVDLSHHQFQYSYQAGLIFIRSCCASPSFLSSDFRMQNISRNVLSFLFFCSCAICIRHSQCH